MLLLVFLMEAMVGILAYVYKDQVHTELEMNLNNTFLENYKIDPVKTEAIDDMQQEVKLSIFFALYLQFFSPFYITLKLNFLISLLIIFYLLTK